MIALSLAKYGYDKYHSDLNRSAEAVKEKNAAFTGYQDQPVQNANLVGDVMSGATTGAMMDQAKANQVQSGKLSDAMTKYYTSRTPAAQMQGGAPAFQNEGWGYVSPQMLGQQLASYNQF